MEDVPDKGPYSVRFRAVLMGVAKGGQLKVVTDGVTRIIALNIENRANDAEWTLPETPMEIKALIGKGPDRVADNSIYDTFGPLERRVYDVRQRK